MSSRRSLTAISCLHISIVDNVGATKRFVIYPTELARRSTCLDCIPAEKLLIYRPLFCAISLEQLHSTMKIIPAKFKFKFKFDVFLSRTRTRTRNTQLALPKRPIQFVVNYHFCSYKTGQVMVQIPDLQASLETVQISDFVSRVEPDFCL